MYRDQGRVADAEQEWRNVLDEQPNFLPATLALGEIYLCGARWDELGKSLEPLFQATPVSTEALLLKARACLAKGEYAGARPLLDECIARDARALMPRVVLSRLHLLENCDPPAAERALQAVLELEPRHAETWANLVKLLSAQKRLPEAVNTCRAGLTHCPKDLDLLLLHGTLLYELNDLPAAEISLLRVIEGQLAQPVADHSARTRAAAARHALALIYRRHERYADAEAQWRAALTEVPDFLAVWLELARLYRAQGRARELAAVVARLSADPRLSADARREVEKLADDTEKNLESQRRKTE